MRTRRRHGSSALRPRQLVAGSKVALTLSAVVHASLPVADTLPSRDLLALGEEILDALLALPDLLFLLLERFGVEELPSEASLAS